MSFILGLTGSIGMGKSTTARMFADEGIPVWDADLAVHRLYQSGQPAAVAIANEFPEAIAPDGSVDRLVLRQMISADRRVLDRLNALIHPLVAQDRAQFLTTQADQPIVLLDVPLLFETGLEAKCDAVAVVSVSEDVQKERVMSRGVTEDEYQLLLSRQLPDADKRARADYIIPTTNLEVARHAVKDVVAAIRQILNA